MAAAGRETLAPGAEAGRKAPSPSGSCAAGAGCKALGPSESGARVLGPFGVAPWRGVASAGAESSGI